MKLLLDQNLSAALLSDLFELFRLSAHVRDFGLSSASDRTIWEFAGKEGYVIVSKDADFRQRSFLLGAPPKVIWIRLGNCSTQRIAGLMREQHERIRAFCSDPEAAFLSLG